MAMTSAGGCLYVVYLSTEQQKCTPTTPHDQIVDVVLFVRCRRRRRCLSRDLDRCPCRRCASQMDHSIHLILMLILERVYLRLTWIG
jgi:hypothetical protein